MKKVLVLLVVFSVASLANAAVVLDPLQLERVGQELYVQTDPLDAADAQQALFLAVGSSGGALDAGEMLYPGTLSAVTDMTADMKELVDPILADLGFQDGATRVDLIELFDGTAVPPDVVGQLVRYTVTALPGSATPVLLLHGETLEVLGGIPEIIPEPVTIALLGLGGLFLRRRK